MDEEEVVCEKVERKGKEIKKEKEEDYKFVILLLSGKEFKKWKSVRLVVVGIESDMMEERIRKELFLEIFNLMLFWI